MATFFGGIFVKALKKSFFLVAINPPPPFSGRDPDNSTSYSKISIGSHFLNFQGFEKNGHEHTKYEKFHVKTNLPLKFLEEFL